jgi:hypothetical protein
MGAHETFKYHTSSFILGFIFLCNVDLPTNGFCYYIYFVSFLLQQMLKSFRVKLLVLSAIPDLVETWVTGFGFKPIEENEKKLLNNITLMLFPGASLLTKSLLDNESERSGLFFNIFECQ